VVEFGEWLCSQVLKKVPHRHFVFSLPKILRRYFLYDRDLLSDLSRCAWESLKLFLREAVPERNPIPGAVIAIQTFGDFLGFNPHCHVLVTDGCFYGKGMFRVAPPLDLKKLEAIFRHNVFKMLLAKGRITQDLIAMLSNWRHSGFQVFCGQRIFPQDETAMENLARYIIRASFSQERMQYLPEPSQVVYRGKDGTKGKVFDAPVSSTGQALEWLAAMCSHIPDRGEQMVRYYGFYSNVSRGKRKETEGDGVPCILEADRSSKEYRKNWARLIQKIGACPRPDRGRLIPDVPEACPRESRDLGSMHIFIQDREVIKAILKHLGLWVVKLPPAPMAHAPPVLNQHGSGQAIYVLDQFSQLPINDDHLHRDPDYPWEAYLQS
jgi:hypothetical protein